MIDWEQWMDIKELYRQGLSQRQIAQQTGRSRNTIAKILGQNIPQNFKTIERQSALDPFKPYLKARWELYQLSGIRLHEDIKAQGFTGSLNVVQRYIKTLKDAQVASTRATVRFETAPGGTVRSAPSRRASTGGLGSHRCYRGQEGLCLCHGP